MSTSRAAPGHYLIASDFDQTLSFNDSGLVLSELIGVPNFREKVAGLSNIHLVQQGAELTYLLRHDPEFRCVRREHLIATGKQVRLKEDIKCFVTALEAGADEYHFSFYVISAAPRTVVESALEGIVPANHIYGAECAYDATSGEICAVTQVPAGYGKVAILEALASRLQISPDRTVYVGDGSSDVHVMLHVNSGNGFTIAVSEAKHITRIARRTVISDNALSVLVPILEDVVGWEATRIRQLFASKGWRCNSGTRHELTGSLCDSIPTLARDERHHHWMARDGRVRKLLLLPPTAGTQANPGRGGVARRQPRRGWRGTLFLVLAASHRGQLIAVVGAEGGTRTPTPLRAHDPESCASANSATSARRASFIIPSRDGQSSRGRWRPDDFHQPPGAARVRDPRDGRGRARAARDGGQVAA